MRVEFCYQLEDVEEGLVPEAHAADPARFKRKVGRGVLGWLVTLPLIAFVWTVSRIISGVGILKPNDPNPPRDLVLDVLTMMVPAGVFLLSLVLMLVHSWRKSRWRPAKPAGKQRRRRDKLVTTVTAAGV